MRCEGFHLKKNLVSYEVYPSVIVNILSHHQRRPEKDERVCGVLLGTCKQDRVIISDSFALQTMIKQEQVVSFEEDKFVTLLKLKKQVNPNEIMVGWYSTCTATIGVNFISALLDNVLGEHARKNGNPAPCYLTVDTNMKNEVLRVRVYRGKLLTLPVLEPEDEGDADDRDDALHKFVQAPLKLIASDAEKIALDVIIKSPVEQVASEAGEVPFDAPSTIEPDMDQMISNLVNLMCDFEDVLNLVKKTLNKEIPTDPKLAWQITSALASSPDLQDEMLNKQTNERVNDVLMVKLLVIITKAQVAISKHLPGVR